MAPDINALVFYLSAWSGQSMAAAARRNGVSVAAISAGVKRLEGLLLTPLFVRSGRGLIPAKGAEPVTRFAAVLLAGLLRIERAFAHQGLPIDLAALTHEMTAMLRNERSLGAFLADCRTLQLTPILVLRFVAVYEHRSIRGAAAALDIAQPQISKQIAAIEAILQTPLFDRGSAGLTPTRAAGILYRGALQLSDLCTPLIRRGDLLFRQAIGTTHLGTVPPVTQQSALCVRLSDLCQRWHSEHPGASIRISADTTDQLLARLKRNDLHAALVDTADLPPGVSARHVSSRPLMLATGRTAPARWQDRPLTEIAEAAPFVMPSRQSSLRVLADAWTARAGLQIRDQIEVESMTVITDLVARHGYVSILPADAADADAGLMFVPLPGAPDLVQHLVWKEEMSGNKHVERLIEALT